MNDEGSVIGISQSTYAEGQNLNFAVPVQSLKDLLNGQVSEQKNKPAVVKVREYDNYEFLSDGNSVWQSYMESAAEAKDEKIALRFLQLAEKEAERANSINLQVVCLNRIGYKHSIVDYKKAKQSFLKVLSLLEDHGDLANPELDVAWKGLALLTSSEIPYRKSLEFRERIYGSSSIETADALVALGLSLSRHDADFDAIPLFKRALAIYERNDSRIESSESNDKEACLRGLGLSYLYEGSPATAEAYLKKAVDLMEKRRKGSSNAFVDYFDLNDSTYKKLANSYFLQKKYGKAEQTLLRLNELCSNADCICA